MPFITEEETMIYTLVRITNKQTGKFSLNLEYFFVEAGTFGNTEVIIQVDGLGNGASAAPAVQTDTLQGAAKQKNLKLIPNNKLKQVEAER